VTIILLSNGYEVIVDDDDYDYLSRWRWKRNAVGYACRTIYIRGKFTLLLMHRLINKTPEGLFTDHINRNKLDNRKSNLRTVTKRINNRNQGLGSRNTSGFKGVNFTKDKKWRAYGKDEYGKFIHLGQFNTPEEAAAVASTFQQEIDAKLIKVTPMLGTYIHYEPTIPKLNLEKAREIRKRRQTGERVKALAKAFGVSIDAIYDVINDVSWKEVSVRKARQNEEVTA
jgi:hypothetical protein